MKKYDRYKQAVRRELRRHSESKVVLQLEAFDEPLYAKVVSEHEYRLAHYTLTDLKLRVHPYNGRTYCVQTWTRDAQPIVIQL